MKKKASTNEFFGMKKNTFKKGGIGAKEAFDSRDHTNMQERLQYLVHTGGLGVFTAAPGMGKTYALQSFVSNLNPNRFTVSYVNLTTVGLREFYSVICDAVGLETEGRRCALFSRYQKYVTQLHDTTHKPLILVVDEAHHLHHSILDDLKLLMNCDFDSRSCFSVVLLGEPRLNNQLNRPSMESLRQRITVHYNFAGLSVEEARAYIEHKLTVAGASTSIVDAGVTATLHSLSNGNPRQMDRLMTQALMMAAQKDKMTVDADILRMAQKSLSLL